MSKTNFTRLKINDKEDIGKVVKHELDNGFDRRTGEQMKLREYYITYEATRTVEDSMVVEAYNECDAIHMAREEVTMFDDVEGFTIVEITVEDYDD